MARREPSGKVAGKRGKVGTGSLRTCDALVTGVLSDKAGMWERGRRRPKLQRLRQFGCERALGLGVTLAGCPATATGPPVTPATTTAIIRSRSNRSALS